TESDSAFLETYSDALTRAGNLDRAREVLEKLLREKNAGLVRLFELANAYVAAGVGKKNRELLLNFERGEVVAEKKKPACGRSGQHWEQESEIAGGSGILGCAVQRNEPRGAVFRDFDQVV